MGSFYHNIYAMPLAVVPVFIILLIAAWAVLAGYAEDAGRERLWIWINRILLILFAIVILIATLASRHPLAYTDNWHLFGKLKAAATVQPEYYREMLMNVFLFVPLGLLAPFALKKPGRDQKTGRRIGIVILIGFLLSVLIELLQMGLSVGLPEAEDVICNTIGTAIGTGAYWIWTSNRKIRKRLLNS